MIFFQKNNGLSKNKLHVLFIIFVLLLFGSYIFENASRLNYLIDFSLLNFSFLILLAFISILARALINCCIYRLFSVYLTTYEGMALAVINTLGNLLPFSGGLIAKGVYLKNKYKLAYTHYFTATISLYVAFLSVNGLIGLIALSYIANGIQSDEIFILFAVFVLMFLGIGALLIPLPTKLFPQKWANFANNLKQGWQILVKNPGSLFWLVSLQLIVVAAIAASFFIVLHMLSQHVGYIHCLLFASTTIITRLVTIVPGGIGIREGIVGGAGDILGFNFGITALAVMIDRIMGVIICFIMAMIYTFFGVRLFTKQAEVKEPLI